MGVLLVGLLGEGKADPPGVDGFVVDEAFAVGRLRQPIGPLEQVPGLFEVDLVDGLALFGEDGDVVLPDLEESAGDEQLVGLPRRDAGSSGVPRRRQPSRAPGRAGPPYTRPERGP